MPTIPKTGGRTLKYLTCLMMMMMTLGSSSVTAAEPVQFKSTEKRAALVELFTSEGCSSCPPADAWLSKLEDSPALWREVVPVAYHVTYWDYLGWKDGLAQKEFTERQRAYAKAWRSDTVYTPGVVLNGNEWRDWRDRDPAKSQDQTQTGVLEMASADRKHWQIKFQPAGTASARYEATVVLLGIGISSDVKAGENRGRKLGHDFVTLKLKQVTLSPKDGALTAEIELSDEVKLRAERLAVAVWVSKSGTLEPLQATGGWLPK